MLNSAQQEFLKSLLTRARLRVSPGEKNKSRFTHTVEDQRSGAGPDERDPATVAALISSLIVTKGWDLQVVIGKLRASWTSIVGEQIADHVAIEQINLNPSGQSGILILRADSTAWATQVRLHTQTIHEKISADFGPDVIGEIQVLGPTAPSWKHGFRSVPGRGPRDTYG